MPWILNEDTALKRKLSALSVPTAGGRLEVPARFSTPEPESADMTYPVIVLTRQAITRAEGRQHHGFMRLPYRLEDVPERPTGATWDYYSHDHPIPYDLDYQIQVLARSQAHLVELAARLAKSDRLPHQGGFLEIPENRVLVSLDVLGGPEFAELVDANGKRLFSASYMVRVASEFFPGELTKYLRVESITQSVVPLEVDQVSNDFAWPDNG
ncbi:hypothetical protein ACFWYW_24200 [Nonomuraea sp. NPDC059023]|uniref:hypothetical protein n=1 Tax=unclassified Nonomuraea TaxID=2593643 RepID=UPI003687F294